MPKPNLFIVGAPKCGTTALHQYLREHPDVFMSMPKEPHYFAMDIPKYRDVKSEEEYLGLFDNASEKHRIIGEASVFYLYSDVAINNIWKFNPAAKIIVMLRNPVQVVYSMYSQLLYTKDEEETEFSRAWSLSDQRKKGFNIPRHCRESKLLYYDEIAKFGVQLARLISIFPEKQIKIIFFEDFIRNTRDEYTKVLSFLGLPDDNRNVFPKINENKHHKVDWLSNYTQRPPEALINILKPLKKIPGLKYGLLYVLDAIRRANSTREPRKILAIDLKNEIIETYRNDILRLSLITDRDLSHWLS